MRPNCTLVSIRFIHRSPLLAVLGALLSVGWSSFAFVSLQAGALPFAWRSSTINYTIQAAGDPAIGDGGDITAVRLAFQAWEGVSSSRVAFFEDADQSNRTDWRSDDLHLVTWDMDNESGFFGGAAGLVAITPVDFDPTTGEILDADILFNGKSYTFSTDQRGGTFDIQNVATHEVGHFIGLDHSAVVGSTMNPFANSGDTRLRSLEGDDIAAASAIYPLSAPPGVIEGFVTLEGQAVSGAHVVAEDPDGNPVSAGLSDGTGFFRIQGLDQGQYAVYAEPLDGPVRSNNFSLHTSGLRIDTNFGTTFYGEPASAPALGRSSPASPDRVFVNFGQVKRLSRSLTVLPATTMNITSISHLTIQPGESVTLSVYGTGLGSGTDLAVPGGGVVVGSGTFSAGSARASLEVLTTALPQLRTVRVYNRNSWACAVLTGGFEVRAPGPQIEGLSASAGKSGDGLSVLGQGFQVGARVLFGSTVVGATAGPDQVRFTVPSGLSAGTYSVAVENPDGQFAKLKDAFTLEASAAAPAPAPAGTAPANPTTTPTTVPGPAQPITTAAAGAGGGGTTQPLATTGGGGGGGGGCTLSARPGGGSPATALAALLLLGLGLGLRRRAAR